jgi:hypothetical protein
MAFIDPALLQVELDGTVSQTQNFVSKTTERFVLGSNVDKFLYWLITDNKAALLDALAQETQGRTVADTGLSNRIDALANSMGTYKATLLYELQASDAAGTASLSDLFVVGMAARNLAIIPNAEYRIIFSQKDAIEDIIEKEITYTNFAGEAGTAKASAAEAFILKTDANGVVANGAIQENPFKRELDAIKSILAKFKKSFSDLGVIFQSGTTALITDLTMMQNQLAAWMQTHGYVFPNV